MDDDPDSNIANNAYLPDVGGVLINQAAALVGSSLASIQGVTFDPASKQLIFLGQNASNNASGPPINMDYFYTAIQAVYGSTTPPYVTLDPPAVPYTQWNTNQTFTNGSTQGFTLLYNPLWANVDTTIAVRFRMTNSANTAFYDFTYTFNAFPFDGTNGNPAIFDSTGTRPLMGLSYVSVSGNVPSGVTLNTAPFTGTPSSYYLSSTSQASYYPINLTNNSGGNLLVTASLVIPARQHRQYGGRVDQTKLGWVMYEADRVMKCLSVGADNILSGVTYSSTNNTLPHNGGTLPSGYYNLIELANRTPNSSGGFSRMWFEPNDMTLQRFVDPTSGQATIQFQSSTVQLLTEAFLQGQAADPAAQAFVNFFTTNYSQFATLNFPVEDPTVSGQIDYVPIFGMLQQAMQAVTLARFLHDNNIPLDQWWMGSYQPPVANSPNYVATAYNQAPSGTPWYLIYGGVRIHKPNNYVPSPNAQTLGQSVLSTRPTTTVTTPSLAKAGQLIAAAAGTTTTDLGAQSWTVSNSTTAVAASLVHDYQDGNVNLTTADVSFFSPGDLTLELTRYYQSSWVGTTNLGPGWQDVRYALQFSSPSYFDQTGLMFGPNGQNVPTANNGDTHLRSGTVRLIDQSKRNYLDFTSSLNVVYGLNAQNNPAITVSGLSNSDLPTFTPGTHSGGATLVQLVGGSYQANLADGSQLTFDANGNLLTVYDRHGYGHYYYYNPAGQLTQISDDAGQYLTLTYSTSTGLLSTVTSMTMNAATSALTANDGITYNYDSSNRLTSVVHTNTGVLLESYTYSISTNQLLTVTTINGTTPITTNPDLKGRSATRTDIHGNMTTWTYSAKDPNTGNRITYATPPSSANLPSPAIKTSDLMGRPLSSTNTLGYTTSFGYTGNSLLPNSVQLPVTNRPAIQIARNNYGQPTSINDPAVAGAHPIGFQYDPTTSLPTQISDQASRVTQLVYTPTNGNPISSLSTNLQTIHRTHTVGGTTSNVDVGFTYDGNDNLQAITDERGYSWSIGRDYIGRPMSFTDPTGVQVSCTYDDNGNVATITDPRLSSPIQYAYDGLHRVISVTTPTGTTTYQYDPLTQWVDSTTRKDIHGNVLQTVSYTYNNSTGQVTSTSTTLTQPGGGTPTTLTTNYNYDNFGNLSSVTPPGQQPINFNYNAVGQLLGTTESNAGPGVGPTIYASAASNGVWSNTNNQTMSWSAPQSSLPITGYSYAEDGTAGTVVNTSGSSLAWSNISDGQHSFTMRAVDSGGKWSPLSSFSLWIDTTPPVVSNVVITPNPLPQGSVTVTLTANIIDAGSGLVSTSPPQFQWCVSSNSSRNWSTYAPMTQGTNNQWSSSFIEPGTGQTLYYQIQAQDAVGNSTVYAGSLAISGPSGNDGPLLPPVAMGVLLLLFFGLGNWLVHRRTMSYQEG